MILNLNNIEQLIFLDKKTHALLPHFRHLFDQWQLGQRIPGMRTLGQRSVFELLNSLKEKHIISLQEYFGDTIVLEKFDHNLVSNYSWALEEQDELCQFSGYRDFCIARNESEVSISFWR